MKKYKIITAVSFIYENIEAENEEEALDIIHSGKIEPTQQQVINDEVREVKE